MTQNIFFTDNKIISKVILVLLGLLAAVSIIKGCMNAVTYSQDFQWDAAKALSMGIDPYDESMHPDELLKTGALGEFYSYFESIDAPQKMEANQFPSLLMLLFPMTLVPPSAARIVWLLLNLIFTCGIIFLLKKTFLKDMERNQFIVVALLMLAGTPYRNQLGVGQHTLFAFAFFLLAVYLSDVKQSWVGTTLALFVSYFKYTLTAPLVLYFIYKRKIREVVVSVALHVLLTLVAAISLGESVVDMIKKPLMVASVLSSEGGIDLGVIFGGSKIAFLLAGVIALLLFVMTLMTPEGYGNVIFAVSLLWSLILTYHRTYDFFVLSAVSCVFLISDEMLGLKGNETKSLWELYIVLLLMCFFVLRLFSENAFSLCVTGILYYGFTMICTIILYRIIKDEKNGKRREA